MKYIKRFEKIITYNEPKVGDYIIIKDDDDVDQDNKGVFDFFNTHVGKILEYEYDSNYNEYDYPIHLRVEYDEPYKDTNIFIYSINHELIEFFSKNKEDVENYLITRKYNI